MRMQNAESGYHSTLSMADLQQELRAIKDQLSLVNKILPVVAELKKAFDAYKDVQEAMETGSELGLSILVGSTGM
ncbi:hypothetical protein PoB_006875500 [Plakobranchus ocellatus]|uniref:Uncharacterized protein n=1 Tax=Plakobranchus ocellatus TaxID=259542 RepID=A0AAV4DDU0_9GAST|nr:hypothetical protein PoB_006875500 [Plakobranchus ocellatus]